MGLNIPGLALIEPLLHAVGLDPKKLSRDQLQKRMEAHVPAIAAAMVKDGETVAKEGQQTFVHDALFRLWRAVLAFPEGGRFADLIRDRHDAHDAAATASQINAATPQEDAVRAVMNAELDLVF